MIAVDLFGWQFRVDDERSLLIDPGESFGALILRREHAERLLHTLAEALTDSDFHDLPSRGATPRAGGSQDRRRGPLLARLSALQDVLDDVQVELRDALGSGDTALALSASRRLSSLGVLFDAVERQAR